MPHAELDLLSSHLITDMGPPTNREADALSAFSGSSVSDLSVLENETDEFGRQILEYQREQLRASRRTTTRALWRDQPKTDRSALPYNRDKLQSTRTSAPENQLLHGHGVRYEPTPPLNVPRGWVRKERARPDWTRRKSVGAERIETGRRGSLVESAAVSRPGFLPTTLADEDDTPSKRRPSTSSSMNHMNTTLRVDGDTDDHDFSSISLLTSTPAVNNRDRRIDRLARAETNGVHQDQAVGHAAAADNPDQIIPPRRRRSLYGNRDKNDLSTRTNGTNNEALAHRTAQPVTFKTTSQPEHRRTDSYNLLRQLARASMSPSPGRDAPPQNAAGSTGAALVIKMEEEIVEVPSALAATTLTRKKNVHERQTVADEDVFGRARPHTSTHPEEALKSIPPGPDQPKSALADIIAESREQAGGLFGEATLNSLNDMLGPETVDVDNLARLEATNAPKHLPGAAREPTIRPAASQKRSDDRDTATHVRQEKSKVTVVKKETSEPRTLEKRAELIPKQSTWKHDTKDDAISAGTIWSMLRKRPVSGTDHRISIKEYQESTNHLHHHSVWRALWTELVECFLTTDSSSPLGFRPTLLGAVCFGALLWFVTEISLCGQFCQPRYAAHMMDYGVDPDAPEFPYVIPTLFFRPFRWFWRPLWTLMKWIVAPSPQPQTTSPTSEPYLVSMTTAVHSIGAGGFGRVWNEDLWRGNVR